MSFEFSQEELEEVFNIFQEESEEQIQKLNDCMLRLESNPEDEKAINEAFRESHSIKGAARMIGLDDIQTIAHKLEDIFGLARNNELKIHPDVIDIMCNAVDSIETIINDTIKTKGTHSIDIQNIVNQLKTIEQMNTTAHIPGETIGKPRKEAITEIEPMEEPPLEQVFEEDVEVLNSPTKPMPDFLSKKLDPQPEKTPPQEKIADHISFEQLQEDLKAIKQSQQPEPEPEYPEEETHTINQDFSAEELKELKQIFYAESSKNIEAITDGIAKLQKYPYDSELLSEIHRCANSLDGAARIINFKDVQDITMSIRDILDQAIKEELFINSEVLGILEKYNNKVKEILYRSYDREGFDQKIDLETLEKNFDKRVDAYKAEQKKPKKSTKKKISLTSEAMDFTEEDLLKDFGLKDHDEDLPPNAESQKIDFENIREKLETNPLALSDEELGNIQLGDLQGITPLVNPEKPDTSNTAKINTNWVTGTNFTAKMLRNSDFTELISPIIGDLKVLSRNLHNTGLLKKTADRLHDAQEYVSARNKLELIAIFDKLTTILQDASQSKALLTEDVINVLVQSLESVLEILHDKAEAEDPALIHQRLTIIAQTVKLTSSQKKQKELTQTQQPPSPPQEKPSPTPEMAPKPTLSPQEEITQLTDLLIEALADFKSEITTGAKLKEIIKLTGKIKNAFRVKAQPEVVAIYDKLENIFSEAENNIKILNKDLLESLQQIIEPTKVFVNPSQEDADTFDDPGMIYQRLIILEQTSKMAVGMALNTEIMPHMTPEQAELPQKEPESAQEHKSQPPQPKAEFAPLFNKQPPPQPTGDITPKENTPPDSAGSYTIKTLRVDTRKLDQLVAQVGELIIAKIKAKERLTDVEKLINLIEDWQRDWSKNKLSVKYSDAQRKNVITQKSAFMPEGTSIYTPVKGMQAIIRENSDRLAHLANHLNLLYHNIQEDDARLSLIINELEDRIKNVRLLPLTTIFNMFPRMVRDIARDQKKEIDLQVVGAETTVDKKIIEEIKSPLIHILRNSIDHGIEMPETRENSGKPAMGRITLSARHMESNVLIEIIDDGRGININAIRRKVIEKGLLKESELDSMSESQIMNIIFWPGFSTGDQVTELSGRGVGMDVVHSKITQLNGKVTVNSQEGKGCTVSIQLPVTMATIQVLLVKITEQIFAIPTSIIKTAVLVNPDDVFYKEGRQSILVNGLPVFICRLSDLLEIPSKKEETEKKEKLTVIVVQTNDITIGFLVDDLLGDHEILHKNLDPPLVRVRNVAGVTTLGSGEVCLILNVSDLIKTAQMNYGMALKSGFKKKEVTKKKDILVVDDSVTTRILERNILRAAGYNVEVAVNGLDALTKLNTMHFDLVVSDVEMPDITGFELVARLKKDSSLSHIPVILVTSLASELDKQKGLKAGASAYITKGSFDQEELLGTIRSLL